MSEKNSKRVISPKKSKAIPWVDFENEVADHMEKMIGDGRSFVGSHVSRVLRKPAYFSKTRNGEIVFDVSVEISSNRDFSNLEILWLLECKDYKTRKVKVDEVEEFHDKLVQVGAHKGTILTRVGFESGAIEVARTHKIALSTLNKEDQTVILMSSDGGAFWIEEIVCEECLMGDGTTEIKDLRQLLSHELSRFSILISPAYHNKRQMTFEEFMKSVEPLSEAE